MPGKRSPRNDQRRRGFALADVLIGGIMLATAMTVILSITSRSLHMQTQGEHRVTASWLADELLTMVLVEGPDRYAMIHDMAGTFQEPFDAFSYEVTIENLGIGVPYNVTADVRWGERPDESIAVKTLIALRLGDPEQLREPYEPVDRDARYFDDEMDQP